MALKRNKQVSVQTGLKREKADSKALLDFFKENSQGIAKVRLDAKDYGDEMMAGDESTEDFDETDAKTSAGDATEKMINPADEDELLNATLVDYEALLRKAKQKQYETIQKETEPMKSGPQQLQSTSPDEISDRSREKARIVPNKSAVLPLSRENQHELDVLAEIRELIKSASSNLNKPAVEYMTEYNKLEQRHRTGLGENRVNDVAMKKVAYEDEYPKQHKEISFWPPTKQSSTAAAKASATALSTNSKISRESPSSSLYDDGEAAPTKSSLQRNDKFKFNLTPSSRRKHGGGKVATGITSKGKAVVKDVGSGEGSLLQSLMRKMQEVRARVDDETRSYSGGVSLGAIYQGDLPARGDALCFLLFRSLFLPSIMIAVLLSVFGEACTHTAYILLYTLFHVCSRHH